MANSIFDGTSEPPTTSTDFDLPDIQAGGELIVLTLYGPVSYFEYRGENFGHQFKLAEAYAQSIGVTTRVEVCRNTSQLLERLASGEGDLIACQMNVDDSLNLGVAYCGQQPITHFIDSLATVQHDPSIKTGKGAVAWVVRKNATLLAQSLDAWLDEHEAQFFELSMPKVSDGKQRYYAPRRRPRSPILNLARGQISTHDATFKSCAPLCSWDWRLLAAQAYQESAFDPEAVSWMGALGMMQLMPSTAREVGVSMDDVFKADANVRGAVRYIQTLDSHYAGIRDRDERINFILAAYNAGPGHVDDARRLAAKYGRNPDRWQGNVDQYVLRMSESRYYNDEAVRHGYFRGSETYNYVNDIRLRWQEYRQKIKN